MPSAMTLAHNLSSASCAINGLPNFGCICRNAFPRCVLSRAPACTARAICAPVAAVCPSATTFPLPIIERMNASDPARSGATVISNTGRDSPCSSRSTSRRVRIPHGIRRMASGVPVLLAQERTFQMITGHHGAKLCPLDRRIHRAQPTHQSIGISGNQRRQAMRDAGPHHRSQRIIHLRGRDRLSIEIDPRISVHLKIEQTVHRHARNVTSRLEPVNRNLVEAAQ